MIESTTPNNPLNYRMMPSEKYLIIFAKNPELGKVKTRLAATIGDEQALEVYRRLLAHTNSVATDVMAHKAVYYTSFIDDLDLWSNYEYDKYLQAGDDLGERMMNAFALAFSEGYTKVVIIGSDCYQLTPAIVEDAYRKLDENEVVFGPAEDGGYYLLGMKQLYMDLFMNKKWSTADVLLDSILDLKNKEVSYALLPTLADVDHEEDLGELKKLIGE